ncbi:MAG: M15 family metallopeptidase [Defluviitaleaceae bacterium]|nr:M15 family metallopeptidase [Defluviitaleaceae bacterium]
MKNKKSRDKRRTSLFIFFCIFIFIAAGLFAYFAFKKIEFNPAEFFNNSSPQVTQRPEEPAAADDEDAAPPQDETDEYAAVPFYLHEKRSRYISYHAMRPTLGIETIVWHVNADLHLTMFEDAKILDDENPLLVNPFNRLPETYEPAELVEVDSYGRLVTPETRTAFFLLRDAIRLEGYDVSVQSAYRTYEYQAGLYERSGGSGTVAPPGFSEHHTGRAVDLWGPGGLLDNDPGKPPSNEGIWVANNCHRFGFIVRYPAGADHITGYPYEPWHITYVGEEISNAMHVQNILTLEEFLAKNPGIKK